MVGKAKNKYLVTNSKYFRYVSFFNNTLPKQGWKIHVSSIFKTYLVVLRVVKSYCYKEKIDFKFVYRRENVIYFLSKQVDRRAFAKLITVYPSSSKQAKRIMEDLYSKLKEFKGPEIFTDISYKGSIIQYRYGNFFHDEVLEIERKTTKKKIFPDNRSPGFYKPSEEIPDLFEDDFKNLEDVNNINGYKPRSPLHLSSYGGIFIVEKNGKFFIMKEGRPNVGFSDLPEGDAIFYRKNEVLNARRIDSKFFPKIIDYFEWDRHFFSIFELKKLNTILHWKDDFCFVFSPNVIEGRKKKIEELMKKLVSALVDLLNEARSLNLVLNDIKADNILWYGKREIYFVDLDTSFFLGEKELFIKNRFSRKERISNLVTDVKKVAYLLFDLIANSGVLQNKYTNHDLVVRYFKYFSIEANLDKEIRDWIMHFLTFNKRTKLGVFKKGRYKPKKDFSAPISFDKKLLDHINLEEVVFSSADSNDIWMDAYKAIKSNRLSESKKIIKSIIKEKLVESSGNWVINVNNEYLSPYLLDGTARLAYLILLFKESFNSDIFLGFFKEKLVPSLRNRFILKSSFLFGISGLAYTFLIAFKILKDEEYLKIAREQVEILQFFYLKKRDCFFDYDGNILSKDVQEIIERILGIFYIDLKQK